MKNYDMLGFQSSMYNPSILHRYYNYRRRYVKPDQTKTDVKVDRPKRTFKYGLEVPKSWKSVVRIDFNSINSNWKNTVKKGAGALVFHQFFDFKSPNYKHPK